MLCSFVKFVLRFNDIVCDVMSRTFQFLYRGGYGEL